MTRKKLSSFVIIGMVLTISLVLATGTALAADTKIRWKECAFDVTITKDFFGYKMIRVGETRKVRVGRVK